MKFFRETAIIDTGCTCSSLMNYDYWDFDSLNFVGYPPRRLAKYYRYENTNILKWRNNNKYTETVPIGTANGSTFGTKIYFNSPLYIKLKNLPAIPMRALLAPLNRPENNIYHYLLGLDFISQLKMTFLTENNHSVIRFEQKI
jgi:hypothetical protein